MTPRVPAAHRPRVGTSPQVVAQERAIDAVGRTRALGLHFIGHFLGIVGLPPRDGWSRLLLDVEPGAEPGTLVSPVSLAVVADLAMGTAIRAHLGAGRRLSTVVMTAHYLEAAAVGPIIASATAPHVGEGGRAFARCELTDHRGALVGAIDAWFVALPAPLGRELAPIPWELPEPRPVPPLPPDAMTLEERAAVEACAAAGRRAAPGHASLVEEVISPRTLRSTADGVTGEPRIGFEHINRVGHVQGGVLYGAAALAARRTVPAGMHLAEGHLQFLAPAHGESLVVEARAMRQGRRTSFTEARLIVDGGLVGAGTFTFHRLTDRDGR